MHLPALILTVQFLQVPVKALDYGKIEPGAKDSVRQTVDIQMGIPTEKAREIGDLMERWEAAEERLQEISASAS